MTATFEGHTIVLRSLVGSHCANLNVANSDEDWKYFVTPTFEDLYNGTMYANASISETLDYDVHDIRKLGALLWEANLNFVSVLFGIDYIDDGLVWIADNNEKLATMNLPRFYNATMGMHREKMSTLLKGTGNTQVLIEKYGYDTKQATHAMRFLLVLKRVAIGMKMSEALWFTGMDREMLIGIKSGNLTLDEFREMVFLWKGVHENFIKEWFAKQVADEAMHILLDHRIKEFIRINL